MQADVKNATTEELLSELAWRMRNTQNSIGGENIASVCELGLQNLARYILEYKRAD